MFGDQPCNLCLTNSQDPVSASHMVSSERKTSGSIIVFNDYAVRHREMPTIRPHPGQEKRMPSQRRASRGRYRSGTYMRVMLSSKSGSRSLDHQVYVNLIRRAMCGNHASFLRFPPRIAIRGTGVIPGNQQASSGIRRHIGDLSIKAISHGIYDDPSLLEYTA